MTGHRQRRWVALLALVLCASLPATAGAVPAAGSSSPATAPTAETTAMAADTANLRMATELALTPDRPGEVRATLTFSIPDRVTQLSVSMPENAAVVDAEGFARSDGGYAWDGETASPTLTLDVNANRTGSGGGALAADGTYLFVDTGPWALVRAPGVGVRWTRRGTTPIDFERDLTVDGEGVAGDSIAYLGPTRVLTREAHGQTFRLAIPAAADMVEDPDSVFATLSNASGSLRVGARDDTVLVVVAPTGTVDWAVRGLETGGADAWVRDTERVDDPGNAWIHEYVHTRQAFTTTESGRWVTEASASWYATLLTLQQGRIGFREFADALARGTHEPQSDAVLAAPATWEANPNYLKGALVLGAVDRRIRTATDSGSSLQAVFTALNSQHDPVSNDDVLAAVEAASGSEPAQAAEEYTTTRAVPDVWGRQAHERAFGQSPALMEVGLAGTARVDGPYRNATLGDLAVAVGERVRLNATVTNRGGTTGGYDVPVVVDGTEVGSRTGQLAPGESRTLTVTRTFDEPGSHTVSVGTETVTVGVRELAAPSVTRLELNRTSLRRGERVLATVTVGNPADVPAVGTVSVALDGTVVAEREVTLPPATSTTLSVPVRVDGAGRHTIAAGDASATVEATRRSTSTTVPGFGVALGAVAVLLFARVLGDD